MNDDVARARSRSTTASWILVVTLALGCGAKSSLLVPDDTQAPVEADPADRACLPSCTVGHLCCAGGCSGAPVDLPNDCCACVAGEVSSADCGGACGACLEAGAACAAPSACCSGACDYPEPGAEKRNCL